MSALDIIDRHVAEPMRDKDQRRCRRRRGRTQTAADVSISVNVVASTRRIASASGNDADEVGLTIKVRLIDGGSRFSEILGCGVIVRTHIEPSSHAGVADPEALLRSKARRDALMAATFGIAKGNDIFPLDGPAYADSLREK